MIALVIITKQELVSCILILRIWSKWTQIKQEKDSLDTKVTTIYLENLWFVTNFYICIEVKDPNAFTSSITIPNPPIDSVDGPTPSIRGRWGDWRTARYCSQGSNVKKIKIEVDSGIENYNIKDTLWFDLFQYGHFISSSLTQDEGGIGYVTFSCFNAYGVQTDEYREGTYYDRTTETASNIGKSMNSNNLLTSFLC